MLDKVCPNCARNVLAAVNTCPGCNHQFAGDTATPSTPGFTGGPFPVGTSGIRGPVPGSQSPAYGAPYGMQGSAPILARDYPGGTKIFVIGLLSLLCCQLLGPFAWIMGNTAVRHINARPGQYSNRGLIQAGRIMGAVATLLMLLGVFAAIVVFAVNSTTSDSSRSSGTGSASAPVSESDNGFGSADEPDPAAGAETGQFSEPSPAVDPGLDTAQGNKCRTETKTLQTASEVIFSQTGTWPTSGEDMTRPPTAILSGLPTMHTLTGSGQSPPTIEKLPGQCADEGDIVQLN